MEALIVNALIPIALVALIISTVQTAYLTLLVLDSKIGRVLFLSSLSLKVWVAVFLALTLLVSHYPHIFTKEQINHLNLGLLVYLTLQPVVTSIAMWRL